MKRVIVIGAGASGMLAAITAARRGHKVTLLEAMEKPGKKLLLTGSGKCNLTNTRFFPGCYNKDSEAFADGILAQFPARETRAFFREIGLITTEKGDGVYPVTGQAASVLEVLLMEMTRLGVRLKCRERVEHIARADGVFAVRTAGWKYEADAVILAAGSKAAPATGSDGGGYRLAKELGHRIKTPLPALVPLMVKEPWIKKLSGIRMPAKITLICQSEAKEERYMQTGELQWTDYGISGIAVFQMSRFAVRALHEGWRVEAELDLLPALTEEDLCAHFRMRKQALSQSRTFRTVHLLTGVLPEKAAAPIFAKAGGEEPELLARTVKRLRLTVCGAKDFSQAQACQGGADCAQFHPKTLESLIVPGFFAAGELLDVDGICGGYNLQWAWSSGFAAGNSV